MARTFANLSKKECFDLYPAIQKNAENNWRSSQVLAENQFYGPAISLAILSVEETIKAVLLILDGRGFKFRHTLGFQNILDNHTIRYYFSFVFSLCYLFRQKFINVLEVLKKPSQNPALFFKVIELGSDKKKVDTFILEKISGWIEEINQELSWFESLDKQRQSGFYCDFQDKLLSPEDYNFNDYLKVVQRLEQVRKVSFILIDTYEHHFDSCKDTLNEMFSSWDKERFYDKLANEMKKTGKGNKKIFRVSRIFFAGMLNINFDGSPRTRVIVSPENESHL